MDDLLTDFIAETRDMMEAIEGEIIAWEADPSDRTRLDAIFRFVHTVKGNCGFFDFPRLERISHAAEDALADARSGRRTPDQHFVSAVLGIIDCINDMVAAIENGSKDVPDGAEYPLIAALVDTKSTDCAPQDQTDAPSNEHVLEPEAGLRQAAPDQPPKPTSKEAPISAPRSIRLPVDLLDRVMSGVSDMVLARNDLANRLSQAGNQPMIDGPFERLTTILSDVRDAITRMRMQRVELLFNTFPRLVRDLSHDLGKKIVLDIEGSDVELDREVIEVIRDPLVHIVRNAIGHGLETPEERLAAGKSEAGQLRIGARQTGNRITIVITDDGRGLNEDKIAEKAVANGLITQSQREAMDDYQIQQLVFEPGLSTATQVSNISGRGVGLDVVRDNLERVGGWIKATSTPGQGASIYLHIPLTLSIIAGLISEVAGQRFAIPQSYVEEVEYGSQPDMDYTNMGDAVLVTMRGQRTRCLSLADILGLEAELEPLDQTFVLIRLANGDQFALAVDTIHNIGDIVVKPLSPALLQTRCYSGTALLDNGQPIMLLDLPQIAQDCGVVDEGRARIDNSASNDDDGEAAETITAMLFTAMDGNRKAARLEMIKRIETVPTHQIDLSQAHPHAVVNDEILPIAGLEIAAMNAEKTRFLRLSDGTRDLLYAVREIEDTAQLPSDLVPVAGDPLVEALVLAEGTSIALIDCNTLLQTRGTQTRAGAAIEVGAR